MELRARMSKRPMTVRRDDAGERRLAAYLLLPRPKDLTKAQICPAACAFGLLAGGTLEASQAVEAVLIWLSLEFLLYQARYQWNDIRGFAADQIHPDRAGRGRLPGHYWRGLSPTRVSALVLFARLVLVIALAFFLGPSGVAALLWLTAGVFGIAVAYEVVRSRATGVSTAVPAPTTPWLVALWITAGAGYALRGVTGLALSRMPEASALFWFSAAVALWALGITFVTMRWVLETMPFASIEAGTVGWSGSQPKSREHTTALLRWLPRELSSHEQLLDVQELQPLQRRASPYAPWNIATVIAGTAAGAM